jgi:hypothetical protein
MPGSTGGGSILNAVVPVVGGYPLVLPRHLCRSFVESRMWVSLANEYHDDSRQLSTYVATSHKSWKLSARLKPADLEAMWQFWKQHPHDAFYYYDPFEPANGQPVGSNYDVTGVSVVGRYTVVFRGDWQETSYMARTEVGLNLAEVA